MNWSLFHNGVAAGLRLGQGQMTKPMTRTWVAYNKPTEPNHTHAGFLLAMGLQGHLAALNMADTYEYLAQVCMFQ
jgi:anaphase-promoting complex subunit 1